MPQIPGFWDEDESQLWQSISEGREDDRYHPMQQDQHALDLFSAGWLEDGYSSADREAIRDQFFDYAIEEGYFYDESDFDWDEWREYMGY